jgi:hypothetical protein
LNTKAQTTLPLEDKVYQLVVVFSSQCCGIDAEASVKLHQLLDSISVPYHTQYWGKEGEKSVYIDLSEFTAVQANTYWEAIAMIGRESETQLVQVGKRVYVEEANQWLLICFSQVMLENYLEEEIIQIILQNQKRLGSTIPIEWREFSADSAVIFKKICVLN